MKRGGVLDQKKDTTWVGKTDRLVLFFMVLGIIFLFQPFSMTLFKLGFPVMILTYAAHSVLDHF